MHELRFANLHVHFFKLVNVFSLTVALDFMAKGSPKLCVWDYYMGLLHLCIVNGHTEDSQVFTVEVDQALDG